MNWRIAGALLWVVTGTLWGQVPLAWNELGPRITGRKVALVLPDGTHVKGKVRSVESDGLRLGGEFVPRASVSVLHVTEHRKLGRLLVTAGTLGAAGAIVAAKYPDLYEGPALIAVPAVTVGGMAGLAAAGYYAGKRLDRRITEIRVTDQPPAATTRLQSRPEQTPAP